LDSDLLTSGGNVHTMGAMLMDMWHVGQK